VGYGYFEYFDEEGAQMYEWLVRLRLFEWAYRIALRELEAAAPRGASVLEIGPGIGRVLELLERRGYRAVGVDVSPAMLRRAKRRTSADLLVGGSWRLPLRGALDAALAVFVLHHWGDHSSSIDSVARALRPGGVFVVLEADLSRAPAAGHGCTPECLRGRWRGNSTWRSSGGGLY
jgi:SAM-dependent methyltransferase